MMTNAALAVVGATIVARRVKKRATPRQTGQEANRHKLQAGVIHVFSLPFLRMPTEKWGGTWFNIGPIIGRVQKIVPIAFLRQNPQRPMPQCPVGRVKYAEFAGGSFVSFPPGEGGMGTGKIEERRFWRAASVAIPLSLIPNP